MRPREHDEGAGGEQAYEGWEIRERVGFGGGIWQSRCGEMAKAEAESLTW